MPSDWHGIPGFHQISGMDVTNRKRAERQMNARKTSIDMTGGKISAQIFRFALPLMAGNLFQQLYSLTDAAIIGRYIGVEALGAVSAVSWLIWFLNAVSRDCSNAFSIAASIRVGQKDSDGFKNVVFHAIVVGGTIGIVVTALMILLQRPMMRMIHIQAHSFGLSFDYLLVSILTLPIGVVFHQAAALLRAAGDSTTTFLAMTVSTVVNILLDLLFVLVLHWGVPGAAIATMIAQGASAAIAIYQAGKNSMFQLSRADCRLKPAFLRELFRLWAPLALNSLVVTVGGVYVQSGYNVIGTNFTAGSSASNKIFSLFEALVMAIQTGASVFVGQNLGARQPDRIREGIREIVGIVLLLCVGIIAVVWSLDDEVIDLFLSQADSQAYEAAHRYGVNFLHFQITGMLVMAPMYIYRITVQTLGHGNYALIAGVLQMVVRIATMSLLPQLIGEAAYYLPSVLAWAASLPMVYFPYRYHIKKLEADLLPRKAA